MLILTRKSGQSFQIGDNIKVTVTEISNDKVKIGIDAPRDLCVLREELCQTMESNRQAAAGVSGTTLMALAETLCPNKENIGRNAEQAGKLLHTVSSSEHSSPEKKL